MSSGGRAELTGIEFAVSPAWFPCFPFGPSAREKNRNNDEGTKPRGEPIVEIRRSHGEAFITPFCWAIEVDEKPPLRKPAFS